MRKHRGKHLEQRQLMNYCAVSTDSGNKTYNHTSHGSERVL